jgi:hypothetical protein
MEPAGRADARDRWCNPGQSPVIRGSSEFASLRPGCGFAAWHPSRLNAKTRRAGLRRVSDATNHFDKNTTTHWTSQARSDLVVNKLCASKGA